MRLSPMMVFCLALFLSSYSLAHSNYEKMLTPGARLLAGDPKKNEFFIVAKKDDLPRTEALLHVNQGKHRIKRINITSQHYRFAPRLFAKNNRAKNQAKKSPSKKIAAKSFYAKHKLKKNAHRLSPHLLALKSKHLSKAPKALKQKAPHLYAKHSKRSTHQGLKSNIVATKTQRNNQLQIG